MVSLQRVADRLLCCAMLCCAVLPALGTPARDGEGNLRCACMSAGEIWNLVRVIGTDIKTKHAQLLKYLAL